MSWKDYCSKLMFDEACVNIKDTTDPQKSLWLYSLLDECVSCPYRAVQVIYNTSLTISTVKTQKWAILDTYAGDYVSAKSMSDAFCKLSPDIGQYGLYELSLQNEGCSFTTLQNPTYPYTELLVSLAVIVILLFAISAGISMWETRTLCKRRSNEDGSNQTTKRRVRAIDAFRGASTIFMIFVNDGCGSYSVLGHTTWDGMLLGDLVFPCFMWIMGVCVPIALSAQLKRGVSKRDIIINVVKRSLLLFLIGVSLNTLGPSPPQLKMIRVPGVLQRLAFAYLVVSLMYLGSTPSLTNQNLSNSKWGDMRVLLYHWFVMLIFMIIHIGLTFGLQVPDCPTGYLGPGGIHEDGKYVNCVGGAAGYIDRKILTTNRIYQRPTAASVYHSGPFDPEGILGSLTATFQVFLGVHTGIILMIYKDKWKSCVIRWFIWAVVYTILGCILHFSDAIPVNKNLWSLSFVFVSTSCALIFFIVCYLLIDVFQIWNGGPFRIPGMNALLLYVGHMMCYQMFPFHWWDVVMENRAWRFIESLWGLIIWTIIAYLMHYKRIYITL